MSRPRAFAATALLLALALSLASGCGRRERPPDPLPRRMVAERGALRYAADRGRLAPHAAGVVSSLGERDRYIVTKASLIDYVSRGGKEAAFFRGLGIDAADWKFLDDYQWMDPTVRREVEAELKRPGDVAPGVPEGARR